jgi:hypothetical protein
MSGLPGFKIGYLGDDDTSNGSETSWNFGWKPTMPSYGYENIPEYGGYLKAQTNLVNKQLAGMDKFGWSDFSNIMGGLSSAANAYTGLRGLSMARNQFNEQSALNRANYSNQAKMLNEQLALKARRTGRAPITLSETY